MTPTVQQPDHRRARPRKRRRGAALIEYCMVLSLLGVGAVAGVQRLGEFVQNVLGKPELTNSMGNVTISEPTDGKRPGRR